MSTQKATKKIDTFGFYVEKLEFLTPTELKKEASREKKWLKMLAKAEGDIQLHKKFEERVLKGLPTSVRGRIWLKILDPEAEQKQNRKRLIYLKSESEYQHQITLDITRSLPKNELFSKEGYLQKLNLILSCYSKKDEELGYCQGMNFIAAMLLTSLDEDSAFWSFVSLMKKKHDYRQFLLPGFPRLIEFQKIWNRAIKEKLRNISDLFLKFELEDNHYCPKWFLTAFQGFNFPSMLRMILFDRFLAFGSRATISFGIGVLTILSHRLLQSQEQLDIIRILLSLDQQKEFQDWRNVKRTLDKVWLTQAEYDSLFKKMPFKIFF